MRNRMKELITKRIKNITLIGLFMFGVSAQAQQPDNLDEATLRALNTICPVFEPINAVLGSNLEEYCFFRSVFLISDGSPGGASGSSLSQSTENDNARRVIKERIDERNKEDAIYNESKFGYFISLQNESFEQSINRYEPGLDSNRNGVILGLDYRVDQSLVLGFATGKKNINGNYISNGGNFATDEIMMKFYLNKQTSNDINIDFIVGYTDNEYKINRRITFVDPDSASPLFVDNFALANTNGHRLDASFSVSKSFQYDHIVITPQVSLDYAKTTIRNFVEVGITGLELSYDPFSEKSLMSTVGFSASYANSTSFGVVIPYLSLYTIHEFEQDQQLMKAHFREDLSLNPTPVNFANAEPDRNYNKIALGITSLFAKGLSAYISVQSIEAYSGRNHTIYGVGLRKEF